MPVEMIVDSLDSVDESIKGAYVEQDGKYSLDVDKYAEVKAQGLKAKTKELLGKLTKANDGLKRFEKLADFEDDDLTEFHEWRTSKGQQPPKDQNVDERIAQLEKAHKKALDKASSDHATITTRAGELEKELKHYKLTVPVRDAALKAGVLPEDMEVVLLDTQSRFALTDEGKIAVLDQDGDPTDITLDKFFSSLYKEMRPKFYAASGASGSGAPTSLGSKAGSKVMRRADFDKLGAAHAAAFMAEVSAGKASLVD